MGVLEWLGIRRAPAQASQPVPLVNPENAGTKPVQEPLPKFQKPVDWRFPREDMRFMSDSEKINLILQGMYSVYDELRPLADDGSRISRLQLLLENLSPNERESVKNKIEELDIDNSIVKFLEFPKSIEEIAAQIRKSYGYAAARLRHLRTTGRVARLRDPGTNKYKYTRIVGMRTPDLSTEQQVLPAEPEPFQQSSSEEEKAEREPEVKEEKKEPLSPESPV